MNEVFANADAEFYADWHKIYGRNTFLLTRDRHSNNNGAKNVMKDLFCHEKCKINKQ